jgi:hypothetical protein
VVVFALHWMSTLLMPLREHIWPARASPDEGKALAQVAAVDWQNFLAHRAEELTSGGQLVLVIGAANETGATGLEPMMDLANDILRTLVTEGKLGAQAYATMTIASRPRSREEFTAPFDKGDLAKLSLEELVISETPNAATLRWRQTGDAAAFASDISSFSLQPSGRRSSVTTNRCASCSPSVSLQPSCARRIQSPGHLSQPAYVSRADD